MRPLLLTLLLAACGKPAVELGVPEPPTLTACDSSFELSLAVSDRLADLNLLITLQVDGGDPLDFEAIVESIGDRGRVIIDVPLDALPVEGGTVLIEVSARIDGGPTDDLSIDLDVAPAPDAIIDADGDGFGGSTGPSCAPSLADEDCDDTNEAAFPGADEVIGNDTDEDCDGLDLCYVDGDFDGYGSTDVQATEACDREGFSYTDDDCDDADDAIAPNILEIIANDIDEDCDGFDLCYEDLDGDGVGTTNQVGVDLLIGSCADAGFSNTNDDCDDTNAAVNPAAIESAANDIDDNCDGLWTCTADNDGDGFGDPTATTEDVAGPCSTMGFPSSGTDCDDSPGASDIYPGAPEDINNGVDEDCDGFDACYADVDLDGLGSADLLSITLNCSDDGVSATDDGDCDDSDATVYLGAPEVPADGIDQNCDLVDDCYLDIDRDGFSAAVTGPGIALLCGDLGFDATDEGDCDDSDDAIFPGQTEVPIDGIDNDCDSFDACYQDLDGDDFGTTLVDAAPNLTQPCFDTDVSAVDGDCDDNAPAINPDATEVCDGIDNNCDNGIDDGDPFWIEADADGLAALPASLGNNQILHICGTQTAGTLTGTGNFEVIGHSAVLDSPFILAGSGSGSFTDLDFAGANAASALTIQTGSTATLSNVQVLCASGAQGITVDSGGSLVSTDGSLVVDGCEATDGGGLYVAGAVSLDGATITNSSAVSDGGGVFVANGATGSISGGSIDGNQAVNGAGVYLGDKDVILSSVNLSSNSATSDGGAVYVSAPDCDLQGLSTDLNSADRGGAIFVAVFGADASGLQATGNSAATGGAVYIGNLSNNNNFTGSTFTDNTSGVIATFGSWSLTTPPERRPDGPRSHPTSRSRG